MQSISLKHTTGPLRALVLAAPLVGLLCVACGRLGGDPAKLIAEAKEQREKRQYNAAVIQLKNVIEKAPEHAEARYLLGMTYRDAGDMASAEKELRRALELRYDPTKVLPPLGKSLLAIGDFKKALDDMKPDPAAPKEVQAEMLAVRGVALLGLGRRAEAQEAFDRALAQHPESSDALLGKARLAAGEQKSDEASRLIEQAIKASPGNADAWVMRGDLARASNPEAAAEAYRKALEASPQSAAARINLALLQIGSGKLDDAAKSAEELRKSAPGNPMAHYLKALIEFRKANFPAAREALQPMLKAAPNSLPALLLAGAIDYALGSHAQAQAQLGRVVERAPGNVYARKLLAASLSRSGQGQRAREVLEPALKAAPQDADVLSLAGEIAMLNNDLRAAGDHFGKATKLDPKSAGARTGLAVAHLASGETDAALADLESAVALDTSRYQADILLILSQLRQGSFDKALKAVESLEKKQPKNPLTFNLKAAVYLGKKDPANARKQLEHALQLEPTYVPAATNLAQLDLRDKNPAAARKRLEGILEKDKNNVQALLTLANLGPQLGATSKEQIDWLERARGAAPSSVQPALALARLYAQSGEPKKALEVMQRVQAANPDNPDVLDALGSVQLVAGERQQALSTFGKLVNVQPKSPLALYRLAGAQAANGNSADAAASLKKALALRPDYVDAQVAMAQLELSAGRPQEAIRIAQQIQKQSPKSAVGFLIEGDVLSTEKKFAQAIKAYETAHAVAKGPNTVIKLHAAYMQAGKPDEAEARLAQWLKQSPDDATVRLYYAETTLKSGNYKKAAELYESLDQKQPDNVVVLNNLAWVYQQLKDARALPTAERAYKLRPDAGAVADTLGWILNEQGNAQRAVEVLRKAVGLAPKSPEIRFHLAQALEKSGDRAGAVKELEAIAGQKFPQQAEAEALLKKLKN